MWTLLLENLLDWFERPNQFIDFFVNYFNSDLKTLALRYLHLSPLQSFLEKLLYQCFETRFLYTFTQNSKVTGNKITQHLDYLFSVPIREYQCNLVSLYRPTGY